MTFLTRLVGPLLARELVRLARGPGLRLAIVAAPTFLLLMMLAEGRARETEGTKQQTAAAAASFVSVTFLMAGVVLALTLPMWICPTIVRERAEGGFDLILTTQLSVVEVLLGVAGAAAAVSAVVAASLAPVVSMMALFGGVDPFGVAANLFLLGLEVACLTGGCLQAGAAQPTPIRATLVGAGQGLGAFFLQSVIAGPVLHGIGRNDSHFGTKLIVFVTLALVFVTITAAMFVAWLRSATEVFHSERAVPAPRPQSAAVDERESLSPDVRRSAMWGPLKLRLDDSEPTRFQIRMIWFIYLGLAMPFCWVIRTGQGATVAPLLFFIWVAIQPFVIVVAATNPLLSRRPGFFDDLLTTYLPNREILTGVMWIVQPALIRLLAAPVGLAVIWLALNPVGNAVGTLLGAAWTAELVVVGAILSLADNRLNRRLLGILAFWGATALAPVFAKVFLPLEENHLLFAAPVCWLLAYGLGRKASWGRVLSFCLLAHTGLVSIAGWMGSRLLPQPADHPLDLTNPIYWMSHCLWQSARLWERSSVAKSTWAAAAAIPFGIALILASIVFWRFALSRFDHLVGRTHRGGKGPRPPARTLA